VNRYFFATAVLLTATLALSAWSERRISQPLSIPLDRIPAEIGGWTESRNLTMDPGSLRSLDATSYLLRLYKNDTRQLELFVAYYAEQRAGESMHSPKHCLPGGGWEIWKQESAFVPVGGHPVPVNKYSIQNVGARMVILYWYQSADRIIASEYMGKLLLAKDTLLTGRTAGSIVRIMLPDEEGAAERGTKFAEALIPEIQRCFVGNGSEMTRQGRN
jgi:EpsI family protein